MKFQVKRWTAVLLVLLMLITAVACKNGGTNSEDSGTSGTVGTTVPPSPSDTTPVSTSVDNLPEDLNFDGATIRMRYPQEVLDEFFFDEVPVNLIDEAVYRTNAKVQTRLGVKYDVSTAPGWDPDNRLPYERTIINSYMTDSDDWDIVGIMTQRMPLTVQTGALIDLTQVDYLDFSKDYWLSDLLEMVTVNGKLYYAAGDASLSLLKMTHFMLYNKELAEQTGISDIQQVALDGGWTKDLLLTYAQRAYVGVDPVKMNLQTDTLGFAVNYTAALRAFAHAFDVKAFSYVDGEPVFVYDNTRAVEAQAWLCDFFHQGKGSVCDFWGRNSETLRQMFMNNRLLFTTAVFEDLVSYYNEISGDYGILPFPKWSEEEEYATNAMPRYISYGIMRTTPNVDMAGAVLECIASESYQDITATYYEEALKVRYSDGDETTRQIFDLVRGSTTLELGSIYSAVLQGTDTNWEETIRANEPNWTSKVATFRDQTITNLEVYLEAVDALDP